MKKITMEIETSAGWVTYHSMMRDDVEHAKGVLKELREKNPQSNLRMIVWTGEVV